MKSINTAANSSVVASSVVDLSKVYAELANGNTKVFKVELNCNNAKILAGKADVNNTKNYKQWTYLPAGAVSPKREDSNVFAYTNLEPKIMNKETNLPEKNPNHFLPLVNLYYEDVTLTDEQKAENAFCKKANIPLLHTASVLKENLLSQEEIMTVLKYGYAANEGGAVLPGAYFYFNQLEKYLADCSAELFEEAGLLTIWFHIEGLGFPYIREEKIDGTKVPGINVKMLAATYEVGETSSYRRPVAQISQEREDAMSNYLLSLRNRKADQTKVVSESKFIELAEFNDAALSKIGIGNKAHKQFKKDLAASVAKGEWDTKAAGMLLAIANRGANGAYMTKNHEIFMAEMRAELSAFFGDTSVTPAEVLIKAVVEKQEESTQVVIPVIETVSTRALPTIDVVENDIDNLNMEMISESEVQAQMEEMLKLMNM